MPVFSQPVSSPCQYARPLFIAYWEYHTAAELTGFCLMENGYEGCGAFHLSRDIDINAQGVSSRRDSHNVVGGEDDYDSGGEERGVHTVRSGKGGTGVGRTKNNYIEVDAGVEAGDEQDTEDKDLLLDKTSLRLAIFGSLNVIYVTAQLTGSMLFGSLVLLSDGFHNLSDV